MPHQSANYEICLHTLYVTLSDCNIVTLLHCYIFMIHIPKFKSEAKVTNHYGIIAIFATTFRFPW